MANIDLRDALKHAASALKAHGPEFALAGTYALWAYGGPEPVHDVDFVVAEQDTEAAALTPTQPTTTTTTTTATRARRRSFSRRTDSSRRTRADPAVPRRFLPEQLPAHTAVPNSEIVVNGASRTPATRACRLGAL